MALLQALSEVKHFNGKPPSLVGDGFNEHEENLENWVEKLVPTYKYSVTAYWGSRRNHRGFLNFTRGDNDVPDMVKLKISDFELDPKAVLDMLAPLPWTLVEFVKIHPQWLNSNGSKYHTTSFGSLHFEHGWACAFKGEGHNRLVSRRWLEHGPWRLLRDEANDVSLIQFHDLEADSATALEQARLGHERMGVSAIGGYIPASYSWDYDVKGIYTPEDRKLEIVVIDREVTQVEMLDYCAGRYYQVLGEDKPLEKIAYIFMKEEQGRPYLHELWLRELECWVFSNRGVRSRIDSDYHPTPNKPDWVRRLEESES
ncbi:MAG: hypothetical protein ACFBSE_03115 [Prochloraceae cyanobacterium]